MCSRSRWRPTTTRSAMSDSTGVASHPPSRTLMSLTDDLPVAAPASTQADAGIRRSASARGVLRWGIRAVGVLWAGVTLAFFALRVIPGDPIQVILGPGSLATPERIAAL